MTLPPRKHTSAIIYIIKGQLNHLCDYYDPHNKSFGHLSLMRKALMAYLPSRYAHSMRVFCFNSGLFYMRPTNASLDLLARVVTRISGLL